MTLRRLSVLIVHLPLDAATTAVLNSERMPWSRVEHLLDELRRTIEASVGVKQPKPHPDRAAPRGHDTPDRRRKIQTALARQHERRRQIEAGLIP